MLCCVVQGHIHSACDLSPALRPLLPSSLPAGVAPPTITADAAAAAAAAAAKGGGERVLRFVLRPGARRWAVGVNPGVVARFRVERGDGRGKGEDEGAGEQPRSALSPTASPIAPSVSVLVWFLYRSEA